MEDLRFMSLGYAAPCSGSMLKRELQPCADGASCWSSTFRLPVPAQRAIKCIVPSRFTIYDFKCAFGFFARRRSRGNLMENAGDILRHPACAEIPQDAFTSGFAEGAQPFRI